MPAFENASVVTTDADTLDDTEEYSTSESCSETLFANMPLTSVFSTYAAISVPNPNATEVNDLAFLNISFVEVAKDSNDDPSNTELELKTLGVYVWIPDSSNMPSSFKAERTFRPPLVGADS